MSASSAVDIHAIQALKARYARAADDAANDPSGARERLLAMFLTDVRGDYAGTPLDGAGVLADYLCAAIASNSLWVLHMIHSPLIVVEGDAATGEWTVMAHLKRRESGQVDVVIGRYADSFRRVDEEWKIERVRFDRLS